MSRPTVRALPRQSAKAGISGLLAAGVIAALVCSAPTAVAAVPAATGSGASSPTGSSADPVTAALASAHTSGHAVSIDGLTDEYSTTAANPDGTLTTNRYVDV